MELTLSTTLRLMDIVKRSAPVSDLYESMLQSLKSATALAACMVIAGCAGANVKLHNPTIPVPLVDKLRLTVAAR